MRNEARISNQFKEEKKLTLFLFAGSGKTFLLTVEQILKIFVAFLACFTVFTVIIAEYYVEFWS
jgi:hypothetical protein